MNAQAYIDQLKKGAFLIVDDGEKKNIMTIGWGSIGYMWNKDVLMVPVRISRHTYQWMKQGRHFIVAVPEGMKKELAFCGTKSGRDVDKFEALGLSYDPQIGLEGCVNLHCEVLLEQAMDLSILDGQVYRQHYSNDDYHVLYYAEIKAVK